MSAPFARRETGAAAEELLKEYGAAVAAHVRHGFDRAVRGGEKFAGAFKPACMDCLQWGLSRREAEVYFCEAARAFHARQHLFGTKGCICP